MVDKPEIDADESTPAPDGGVTERDPDVFTSEEQGEQYRETVYQNLDYTSLPEAPDTAAYPDAGERERFRITDLPKVPKVNHLVGPSAIMLGASLGSGETMFWPTLIAQNGWGLYWAFWVGVLTQFFINTELQRWAMATGESIFRGFDRLSFAWPWFFLVAGFFNVGWPGWAAGASEVFAAWTGIVPRSEWWIIGVATMGIIWLSYQAGPVVYNVIENAQIGMMIIAIIGAVILMFMLNTTGQLANIPAGAVNFGALPANMDIATFLGGLAYAGAGGYTNLAQGVWAREKGFGMGTYQGRVKNPLRGAEPEEIYDGFAFEPDDTNMRRWKAWWKVAQQEHFLTFVIGLLVVATIAMTIAADYAAGASFDGAINMWLNVIIPQLGAAGGWLLYAVIFIALFSTQYAQTEVFVRNSVDIVYQRYGRRTGMDISRLFLALLTLFTVWGMLIIGFQFQQPWILLVIGAAIAGAMMWPYNALTIILNTTRLPEHLQPGWARTVAMWWATGFFGYFTILLIGGTLNNPEFGLSYPAWDTTIGIVGSGVGGYLLWIAFAVVQVYTMYRSGKAKLDASGTVEDADDAKGFLA